MSRRRDIVRQGRRDLHNQMKIPAIYVPPGGEGVLVHVRDHTKLSVATVGAGDGWAGMNTVNPALVFDLTEVPSPRRGAAVYFSQTEGYTVGVGKEAVGEFQKYDVNRRTAEQVQEHWQVSWEGMLS